MPSMINIILNKPKLKYIHTHPFVKMILNDTLSDEAFEQYSKQDELYLKEWAKVIRKTTHRIPEDYPIEIQAKKKFILKRLDSLEEQIGHGHYYTASHQFKLFKPQNPHAVSVVNNYIHFLYHSTQNKPLSIGFASFIPCCIGYANIGRFSKNVVINNTHRRKAWIADNYKTDFITFGHYICDITAYAAKKEIALGLVTQQDIFDTVDQGLNYEEAFFDSVIPISFQMEKIA